MEFVKQYNAATEAQRGQIIPVEVTIFEDRSFTFVLKTPPTAELLKQAAKIDKGSSTNKRTIVGSVSRQQVEEIANTKMKDLNAYSLEAAVKQVIGTATSMGIKVVEE
jgi:large subunit ribosomal protein L11